MSLAIESATTLLAVFDVPKVDLGKRKRIGPGRRAEPIGPEVSAAKLRPTVEALDRPGIATIKPACPFLATARIMATARINRGEVGFKVAI